MWRMVEVQKGRVYQAVLLSVGSCPDCPQQALHGASRHQLGLFDHSHGLADEQA